MASTQEGSRSRKTSSFAKRRAKVIRMQKARNGRGINSKSVAVLSVILVLAAGALYFVKNNELNSAKEELTKVKDELAANEQMTAQLNEQIEMFSEKQDFLTDDKTKVVALTGTSNSPDAKAKVYWNEKKGEIMLVGMNLPLHEIDKQYQLWAKVDGKHQNIGLLDQNNPNAPFTKKVSVQNAQGFAISLELKDGNTSPNLNKIYVQGNL